MLGCGQNIGQKVKGFKSNKYLYKCKHFGEKVCS